MPLYYCGLSHVVLLMLMVIIAQFDHRQLMGVNLWAKPIKFAVSIAIYCFTWALVLQYLPFQRIKQRFANFTTFAMAFEMLAISSQAARGQLSHFNLSGIYNSTLFHIMGVVIVSQTIFAIYIGIKFFKVRAVEISEALLWAIRLGIIMTCFFALEGGIMAARLSHTIGAADGGPGLPVFNWSSIAGDLRIAHFFGMHSLQVIPMFVLITRVKNARPVILFAFGFFVFVSLLLTIAFLSRPVF
jgi:hypothetical protein